MDFDEFLIPVPIALRNSHRFSEFTVSNLVRWEIDEQLGENAIVLLAVAEYQNDGIHALDFDKNFQQIRENFYHLSRSNWQKKIYDLGTILPGSTFEDTCFALHQVVSEITQKGATVIVMGGTQALNYILYKSLKKDLVKVGTVDIKLDIDATHENLNDRNHITKMILDETHRLLGFVNVGSQAPYIAKEEFDILEQLNFEDVRLGKVVEDVKLVEPLFRELDLLSVDMNAMQNASFSNVTKITANGFNEREICGLARYAGLGSMLKVLHIANFIPFEKEADDALIAEMLWYFTEAQNNQKPDSLLETYRVQMDEDEIVFIKSITSERWWIEISADGATKRVPCAEHDYLDALEGELPEKWLRFYKKFY